MKKKAAMELSVTAIVILILAIVMLGLALGFITGMFGKVSTQFEQQIATEREPPIPTAAIPITVSRESIITHAKDSEVLKVALYNPTNEDWNNTQPTINCLSNITTNIRSNPKTIKQGESDSYNVLFTIDPKAQATTYLCSVEISATNEASYTKDFTIKVIR